MDNNRNNNVIKPVLVYIFGSMRILAISDFEGGAEKVSDALEGVGASIVEKEVSKDRFEKAVAEAIKQGKYDMVIAVPEDHIGASMRLNREAGMKAALCASKEDAFLAKKNGANVIIIRRSEKEIEYIAEGLGASRTGMGSIVSRKTARKEEKEESDEGEESEEDMPRRKGFIGSLKDSLGIVDEGESGTGSRSKKGEISV